MGEKSPTDTHVLNDEWTFYLNERPPKGISQEEYERSIHKWGVFATIEGFWRHMNALDIQKLPTFSTLRMFKSGIKPSWEDPANSRGGKYVLDTPKNITPRLWRRLVLAIIGGTLAFSDQICGVVLSVRPQKDGLQIWNRSVDEIVSLEDSLRELREVMGLDEDASINYQAHRGSLDFNSHAQERKKNVVTKQSPAADAPHEHGDAAEANGHPRAQKETGAQSSPSRKRHQPTIADDEEAGDRAMAADTAATADAAASDDLGRENGHHHQRKQKQPRHASPAPKNTEGGDAGLRENGGLSAAAEHAADADVRATSEADTGQQQEEENQEQESDFRAPTRSWADMPSDDDDEAAAGGDDSPTSKATTLQADDDGFGKPALSRSIDWAEMAEEGEDEVSDTSWLTEDDMSEDLYTPYESEGEESLEAGALTEERGRHHQRQRGQHDNGADHSAEEGRRRDFKDLRDSPHARSHSKERTWHDTSGQWRGATRPQHPGHRKNSSVGKYENAYTSIRKSASNADIGPKNKLYKQPGGFKINPSNSGNLPRSVSNTFQDYSSSDLYSTHRHKRSTSTSETSQEHYANGNRLYSSQDKMRGPRRATPPPGFASKSTLEPSPLASTASMSPRTSGLSPRNAGMANGNGASSGGTPATTPTSKGASSSATPPAKRNTPPPTNPWKSVPATILPPTPKASFAAIAGAGTSQSTSPLEVTSPTPPASPRHALPAHMSASPPSSSSSYKESPAPPPSSPVITPSKSDSSLPSYAAAMCDAPASPAHGQPPSDGFASSPVPSAWRPKGARPASVSASALFAAAAEPAPTSATSNTSSSSTTTTTTTTTPTSVLPPPQKGFKREFFYKPRELMQAKPQTPSQPHPQPFAPQPRQSPLAQGAAPTQAESNGRRSRSPRGAPPKAVSSGDDVAAPVMAAPASAAKPKAPPATNKKAEVPKSQEATATKQRSSAVEAAGPRGASTRQATPTPEVLPPSVVASAAAAPAARAASPPPAKAARAAAASEASLYAPPRKEEEQQKEKEATKAPVVVPPAQQQQQPPLPVVEAQATSLAADEKRSDTARVSHSGRAAPASRDEEDGEGDHDDESAEEAVNEGVVEQQQQQDEEDEEEQNEDDDEQSGRRTPSRAALSRRRGGGGGGQAKKTPSKSGKRASTSKRAHRRSRGPVIDFLKDHEQEFYVLLALLTVVILGGTAFLILGLPSAHLF